MGRKLIHLGVTLTMVGALAAQAGEPAGVVLDWGSSSWRYHLTIRSPQYASGGYVGYFRGWHIEGMLGRVSTPDAPTDWIKPEFDDSAWPREAHPDYGVTDMDPVVHVERLRGKFEVADPSRVTGLSLHLEYIGGAAVWLNGHEVGRQNLPAGNLTVEAVAEGYSEEAYEWGLPRTKEGGEISSKEWGVPTDPKARRWRTFSLAPDPKLLRKGNNVLAVSLHQSSYHVFARKYDGNRMGSHMLAGRAKQSDNEAGGCGRVFMCHWPHLMARHLKLAVTPAGAVCPAERPAGFQEWVADIHQRFGGREFGEPGEAPLVARIVAARNGTHSAQVVVGTAEPLAGLAAKMSDLVQGGGAGKIPADAICIRYALALVRNPKQPDQKVMDHLSARPPAHVLANTCQPVWITVKVPKDAAPGEYRGTLTLLPAGLKKVEVRLQVLDWALPDSKDFASFVGLQQCFWSAPAEYKVKPWSEEHWQHLEKVVRWLGEVGNDAAVLPLICGGELANEESLVTWVKKGGPAAGSTPSTGSGQANSGQGSYDYDWKNLDRYLDLVAKHWGTKVALVGEICWAPFGVKSKYGEAEKNGYWYLHPTVVTVRDAKEPLVLPAPGSEEWKKLFLPFAKALRQHLQEKKFEKLYWGWFHDWTPGGVQAMAAALAAELPEVGWTRASHNGNAQRPFSKESKAEVTLDMRIRQFTQSFDRKTGAPVSQYGWKRPSDVLFPRLASMVQCIGNFESPMALHWLTENALVNGASGVGRMCADSWPSRPMPNHHYSPYMTEAYLLPPGSEGADGSQRFEGLREGVQEAEVRIWLEKNGKDQAEPAKAVLADRIRALNAMPAGMSTSIGAYYAGWQERSWDLYAAAAAAAGGNAPSAEDRVRFFGAAPGK